ncbi:MAG: CoA transferase, partial [Chloroflexota bacterium]|nr:CoA transferase [Chloroflexota bacterium]
PFCGDKPHPEASLLWWAYNANKRGITLDLQSPRGQELFLELAKRSHFVIESFPPGYLDSLGLGYQALRRINPALVLTSITPFGQTGPYRDRQTSDLVALAMGGLMYLCGDPDRPPVRVSAPQAYLHAGVHAACGTLIAHYHRELTGEGQQVDVSIHESVLRTIQVELPFWQFQGEVLKREGPRAHRGRLVQRQVWPCQDGYIGFRIVGGRFGRGIRTLVEWMEEEEMAGVLSQVPWEEIDLIQVPPEENARWEELLGAFFLRHTKEELYREAVRRRIFLLPAYTTRDILDDGQLTSREFWVEVEGPGGRTLPYPGAPFKLSRTPWSLRYPAPHIGQHNREVYEGVLGLSAEQVLALKKEKVI